MSGIACSELINVGPLLHWQCRPVTPSHQEMTASHRLRGATGGLKPVAGVADPPGQETESVETLQSVDYLVFTSDQKDAGDLITGGLRIVLQHLAQGIQPHLGHSHVS